MLLINCPSIYPFHPESQKWKVEWNQASSIRLTCCCFPCQECKALCKEVDSKEALDCHLRGRDSGQFFSNLWVTRQLGETRWFLLVPVVSAIGSLVVWVIGCYWWFGFVSFRGIRDPESESLSPFGPFQPPNHQFVAF